MYIYVIRVISAAGKLPPKRPIVIVLLPNSELASKTKISR